MLNKTTLWFDSALIIRKKGSNRPNAPARTVNFYQFVDATHFRLKSIIDP